MIDAVSYASVHSRMTRQTDYAACDLTATVSPPARTNRNAVTRPHTVLKISTNTGGQLAQAHAQHAGTQRVGKYDKTLHGGRRQTEQHAAQRYRAAHHGQQKQKPEDSAPHHHAVKVAQHRRWQFHPEAAGNTQQDENPESKYGGQTTGTARGECDGYRIEHRGLLN